RYDGPTSNGDQGGNAVSIVSSHGPTKLHTYWDHLADHLQVSDVADPAAADLANMAPDQWADESFKLARDVAYKTLPTSGTLTAAYEQSALSTASARISLAGNRLALLLKAALAKGGGL